MVSDGFDPACLSPCAARALASLRAAGRAAAAAEVSAGPPPADIALQAWAEAAFAPGSRVAVLTPLYSDRSLLWAVEVRSVVSLTLALAPPGDLSTNPPPTRLGFGAAMSWRGSEGRCELVGRDEVGDEGHPGTLS
jgi:hypothetical protein